MATIAVEVWLYGALARYGGEAARRGFASLAVRLPQGSTVSDLLAGLGLPTRERGVTFINGQLSAMPGLQPDLGHALRDGDRVGLFDGKSMWPFQYRHGAALTEEMAQAVEQAGNQGLRHSYEGR
jgi:sulfur carrier protein ThiS